MTAEEGTAGAVAPESLYEDGHIVIASQQKGFVSSVSPQGSALKAPAYTSRNVAAPC